MLGKIEGRRRRGWQRMRWVDSITDSMDKSLGKLREIVKDRDSSASMAQKFGSAFGGAAVMWILAGFGYDTTAGAVQTETAILGLQMLMSWVPAIVAVLSILVVWFYPLTKKKMEDVQTELAAKRSDTDK